jgi:hypothetical protein
MFDLAPPSSEPVDYDIAWLYCATLEYNGHRDWRMPTAVEYALDESIWGWYVDRSDDLHFQHHVKPVRTV